MFEGDPMHIKGAFWAMQRLTGRPLQIVLNTDANAGDLRDNLSYIYGLYVEYVMKNPLYTPGEPFRCDCLLMHSADLHACRSHNLPAGKHSENSADVAGAHAHAGVSYSRGSFSSTSRVCQREAFLKSSSEHTRDVPRAFILARCHRTL